MEQIKVKELYELCKAQIEKGNGDKYIAVADDNEGNGYHGMFFGFSEDVEDCIDLLRDSQVNDINELIILGQTIKNQIIMSTRATIKVIGKGKNPVWIYHHTDGYPEGVGEELKQRLSKEGSRNFYTIVNDILHIDIYYELTSDQHGDENYAYLVDTDNRILKCYRVGWDEFDWKEEKVEFEFKF